MASTRKGSKKVGGATRSRKAAGTTRASKKGATKGGPGGGITHPPVIVTDGSAAIGLVPNVFRRDPSGGTTRVGRRLRLLSVEVSTPAGGETCVTLQQNESAVITVNTSLNGSSPKSFTVSGINSNDPSSSLVLDFDHGVFPPGPVVAGRRHFRNPNRTIDSMEIVTSTGQTHDCNFVGDQAGLVITFRDDHV